MSDLPLQLEHAILEALDAEPAASATAIERICAEHPEHAAVIRRRLAAMESIRDELSTQWELSAELPEFDGPIGPYEPVRLLGEGGMGRVYLATQEKPVRRTVALKVMKAGLGAGRLVERFSRERHTLARLSHSGIARIFDAGSTSAGLQYFAMEYVEGEALLDYCDKRRLGVETRLQLLCRVCDAVQHAHQKGVIHRDLKPGNILVTEEEGASRVVVIDFGLARIVESLEDDGARFTEQGVIVGTPEYMSPEQADPGDGDDVDSRSDIYALGVILYELLVGRLPIDFEEARRQGPRAMQKRIRSVEPLPPSRRLLEDPDREHLAARCDKRQAARYARELAVDLDWVTAKALAKDPRERYQSAGALLADLQRYLVSEPVQAGPPSASYRIKKLLRRHRGAVAAGAALLLSLTVGLVVSLVFFFAAETARASMKVERDAARREAKLSAAINTILEEDLLMMASPKLGDRDLMVRDALANAAMHLDERLVDEPLVEASIRGTIGITFENLGELESAMPQLERAHDLYRQHSGADSEEALNVLAHIGAVQRRTGHEDAQQTLRAAAARAARTFGPNHALTLRLQSGHALVLTDLGQYPAAEEVLLDVVRRARVHLSPDDDELPSHINNLAVLYQAVNRLDDAGRLFSEVIELWTERGRPNKPLAISAMSCLGSIYSEQGRHAAAVAQQSRALELQRGALGDTHANTIATENNLAMALLDQGEMERAKEILEALIPRLEAIGPPQRVLAARNNLATACRRLQQWEEAEPIFRQVVDGLEAMGMGEHPHAHTARASLALVLAELGQLDEAATLLQVAAIGRRDKLGTGDKRTVLTMRRLARLHVRRKDAARAARCYRKTLEWGARAYSVEDKFFDSVHLELAEALAASGDTAAAASILNDRLEALRGIDASEERLARVQAASRALERPRE